MSGSARDRVAAFWDQVVADFFQQPDQYLRTPTLRAWRAAYQGRGRGSVTDDACPEPYIGPLATRHGEPAVVTLGLNPGEADLKFQGPDGVFKGEIAQLGGFSEWAVSAPYLRAPWAPGHRRNRFHEDRLSFARRWTGDPTTQSRQVLVMELFPWHSDAATAVMRPDPGVIEEFVWQPLAETRVEILFAFGRDWGRAAEGLGLREHPVDVGFATAARRMREFELPSGQRLAVIWQSGYSGPPGEKDVETLRRHFHGSATTRTGPSQSDLAKHAASAQEEQRCIHDMLESTCSLCRWQRLTATVGGSVRGSYVADLISTASPGLQRLGFGPLRAAQGFLPCRWPNGLWYRRYTQNDDVHIAVRDNAIEFRVHSDAFHGDRARNSRALDLLRSSVERELSARLPPHDVINWRAAGAAGGNQVCAVSTRGGLAPAAPEADAAWLVAVAAAWLTALQSRPLDLHLVQ